MVESTNIRVLYVEDDPGAARLLQKRLHRAGYAVDIAQDWEQGRIAWQTGSYDVLALDHDLPGKTGLEIISQLSEEGPLPPTIMITGRGSETLAVEAMKMGADDYIIKDHATYYLDLIPTRIERAITRKRLLEDKRLAEEEALRARDEWERTFDAVEDPLMILNTDQIVVRANKATADRLGMTKEQLVGKHCFELFHRTPHPVFSCPCVKMLSDGTKHEVMIAEPLLGGVFQVTAIPLRDGKGAVTGCVHVARDVTASKKAEEELRRSEHRYRTLFEQSMDAIIIVHPEGEIVDANSACAELLGASREEIIGTHISAFYWNPEDRPVFRNEMEQTGFVKEFEWKAKRLDGTMRTCLIKSSIWKDRDGSVVGFLSIVRDVTQVQDLSSADQSQ